MEISIDQIKKIRDMTGAGVNGIRDALTQTKGNEEEALKILREKGMAKGEKRKEKNASNGVLGVYVHSNSKVVVVVEVNCETDFAAKSTDLIKFANDIALQIAATSPKFISRESVDAKTLEEEKQTYLAELEGKPEEIKNKILDGKLEKFYKDNVLMDQQLFVDDSKTVTDYFNELLVKIGEKLVISKFTKFEVAQETTGCQL